MEQANRFLREHGIGEFNRRFAVRAGEPGSDFLACAGRDLDRIFSIQHERVVNRDNTVQVENRCLQIDKTPWRATLAGCHVMMYEHLDGTLSIGYGPHTVGRYTAQGVPLHPTRQTRPRVAARRRWALTPVALRAPSVSAQRASLGS